MEVRITQMKELEGPITAPPADDTPSPPPACRHDGDAPVPLSSGEESSSSDGEEFEFEFPFVSRESPAGTAAPADELFVDGRIRPFYPVFGRVVSGGCVVHGSAGAGHDDGTARLPVPVPAVAPRVRGQLGRLFLEETRARNSSTSSTASTSSSAATDDDNGLDGAAPESYCVWRPGTGSSASASASSSYSPRPPRKSGSTGSMARWRRISDLVVGRSHSDGKEKFLFFATPPPHEQSAKDKDKPKTKPAPVPAGSRKPIPSTTEVDTVTAAHRIAYLATKGGGGPAGVVPGVPGGTPRRTFLPYREELVGFFANVNGVSRSHQHPF